MRIYLQKEIVAGYIQIHIYIVLHIDSKDTIFHLISMDGS